MTSNSFLALTRSSKPPLLLRRCRRFYQQRQCLLSSNIHRRELSMVRDARWIQQRQPQERRNRCTATTASFAPIETKNQQRRHYLAWLNPFSKNAGARDSNAVVGSARTKTEEEAEQPRKLQERKDLTLLMLALEFHKIASAEDHESSLGYLENREAMIDKAFERLEEIEIDNKSMMQLRYAVQEAMEEQVIDLFDAFASIDEELLLFSTDETDDDSNRIDIDSYLEETLRLELERTIDELVNTDRSRAPKGTDPKFFLTLKRGAIETILDRDGTRNRPRQPDASNDNKQSDVSWTEADEFGYHVSIDEERNKLIRYYQSINLCRSAKMRDKLGYSVVAMRSSIPGAGRGVYVDGYARAGSILAFQPGPVWSKESLVNLSVEEERDLERNDSYQMSLRADDYMIDSRRSPYTVLTDDNSNLMALGHIVNHPSPSNPPSCRSAMLNFTQGMGLGSKAKLKRYIPNTYARPRNVTLMDSLWDRDVIEMHSLVLVATRDICNEEIFYDYRLASGHLPQWYHKLEDTAFEAVDDMENDSDDNEEDKQ